MAWRLFHFMIFLPAASGCGPLQAGQERTINFTVSDFKLPAIMVYSEDAGAKSSVPAISSSKNEAEAFVRRLIMESVESVVYQQGRSALLPDFVINSILQQIDVQISYEPLHCIKVINPTGANPNAAGMNMINCIIVDNTVTSTCSDAAGPPPPNCMNANTLMNAKSIDSKFLSISGSVKTSNAIMANWSNQMWKSVLNRVLRSISSSPIGSYFNGASINFK